MRTTREVIDDHLGLAREGDVEADLRRNYSPDVLVLIADGVYRGHDGVRVLAERLNEELPDATFEYTAVLAEDDVALLEWTGKGRGARVTDGADSFVVRDGLIVAQTIHYTLETN